MGDSYKYLDSHHAEFDKLVTEALHSAQPLVGKFTLSSIIQVQQATLSQAH